MKYVLDSNVAIKWVLTEPDSPKALALRADYQAQIHELLAPDVVVLLIGERPGLATAESLSAYLAYRPRATHTDAQRNLISNIHTRGVACLAAATRIINLAEQMMRSQSSGVEIREPFTR